MVSVSGGQSPLSESLMTEAFALFLYLLFEWIMLAFLAQALFFELALEALTFFCF